tara:strand:- start:2131 stop:2424 length:294 start_codon:yes stop_codon:yes gene_type:complete
MHKDKFRSAPTSKKYKNNHESIFGPAKGAPKLSKADKDRQELRNKEYHAKLAEDGKKPAEWYLANERRVPSDPNYQKKMGLSRVYDENYARVFRSEK